MTDISSQLPPASSGSVELTRELGFWDITLIGVGAMIGAGIFVLVGSAAGRAGPALVLAFVLNSVVALLTALVYAELGSALPSAGGSFVFIRQAFPPSFAFIAGWMSWFAAAVAGSLYALGFGSFTEEILRIGGVDLAELGLFAALPTNAPAILIGVLIALFFFYINFRGASETGAAGAVVTVAKIAVILLFVAGGMWVLLSNPERLATFQPFAPNGLTGVFLAMGITYVAFEGFEVIVQAGEEVKDPKRTVPKAIIAAMVIVIPIYILVGVTLIASIDPPAGYEASWQWLGEVKELGLARAATQVIPFGNLVILVGGLLSTMSALNATTFASTRVSFAMGRDRFLPPVFARIHPRNRTPHGALGFTGLLILFMLVALPLESVAESASLMFLLLFLMVNVSSIFIRIRYGDKLAYGYLTPFFPAVPVLAVAIQLVLAAFMLNFSIAVLGTAVGWLALGGLIYFFYASRHELYKVPTPVVVEERPVWATKPTRPPVLVPVARPEESGGLTQAAAALAESLGGHVLIHHVVSVPEQLPLSAAEHLVEGVRDDLHTLASRVRERGVPAELLIQLAHDPAVAIRRTAAVSGAQFCVAGWRRERRRGWMLGSTLDPVLRDANANFVLMVDPPERAERIVIPASNPAQGQVAFAVAFGLGRSYGTRAIDVVIIHGPDKSEGHIRILEQELAEAISSAAGVTLPHSGGTEMVEGVQVTFRSERRPSVQQRVIELGEEYDLMVLGAGPGAIMGRDVLGRFTWEVARQVECPVVIVKRRAGPLRFRVQTFFDFFRDESRPGDLILEQE